MALIHPMRLSLMKGAHADPSSTASQEIGVKPSFGLSGVTALDVPLTRLPSRPMEIKTFRRRVPGSPTPSMTGFVECCVSHSSPKTGLEWGTQRSLPVQKARSLLSLLAPRGPSLADDGPNHRFLKLDSHKLDYGFAFFLDALFPRNIFLGGLGCALPDIHARKRYDATRVPAADALCLCFS